MQKGGEKREEKGKDVYGYSVQIKKDHREVKYKVEKCRLILSCYHFLSMRSSLKPRPAPESKVRYSCSRRRDASDAGYS